MKDCCNMGMIQSSKHDLNVLDMATDMGTDMATSATTRERK